MKNSIQLARNPKQKKERTELFNKILKELPEDGSIYDGTHLNVVRKYLEIEKYTGEPYIMEEAIGYPGAETVYVFYYDENDYKVSGFDLPLEPNTMLSVYGVLTRAATTKAVAIGAGDYAIIKKSNSLLDGQLPYIELIIYNDESSQ